MQELFAWGFRKEKLPEDELAQKIIKDLDQIDALITQSAPSWPLDKINKIDLSILRLAVYELMVDGKNPPKVVVDEAVEIAKEYGATSSPGFINGALGKLIIDQQIVI